MEVNYKLITNFGKAAIEISSHYQPQMKWQCTDILKLNRTDEYYHYAWPEAMVITVQQGPYAWHGLKC